MASQDAVDALIKKRDLAKPRPISASDKGKAPAKGKASPSLNLGFSSPATTPKKPKAETTSPAPRYRELQPDTPSSSSRAHQPMPSAEAAVIRAETAVAIDLLKHELIAQKEKASEYLARLAASESGIFELTDIVRKLCSWRKECLEAQGVPQCEPGEDDASGDEEEADHDDEPVTGKDPELD